MVECSRCGDTTDRYIITGDSPYCTGCLYDDIRKVCDEVGIACDNHPNPTAFGNQYLLTLYVPAQIEYMGHIHDYGLGEFYILIRRDGNFRLSAYVPNGHPHSHRGRGLGFCFGSNRNVLRSRISDGDWYGLIAEVFGVFAKYTPHDCYYPIMVCQICGDPGAIKCPHCGTFVCANHRKGRSGGYCEKCQSECCDCHKFFSPRTTKVCLDGHKRCGRCLKTHLQEAKEKLQKWAETIKEIEELYQEQVEGIRASSDQVPGMDYEHERLYNTADNYVWVSLSTSA